MVPGLVPLKVRFDGMCLRTPYELGGFWGGTCMKVESALVGKTGTMASGPRWAHDFTSEGISFFKCN